MNQEHSPGYQGQNRGCSRASGPIPSVPLAPLNHSVAVLSNGTVRTWGINGAGYGWPLTNAPNITSAAAVAAGALHSVVLRRDGTVAAWGYNGDGQTNVPAGLSGVKMVAAGWSSSLAVQSNGTLRIWGYVGGGVETNTPSGLTNVQAAALGARHVLAIRAPRLTPLITLQPRSQRVLSGNATFSVKAASLGPLSYQWRKNGGNLAGATTSTLTTNSQATYTVLVSNGAGSVLSAPASLGGAVGPTIYSPTVDADIWITEEKFQSLRLVVDAGQPSEQTNRLVYHWFKDGIDIGCVAPPYINPTNGPSLEGHYWVVVTNGIGSATSAVWNVFWRGNGTVAGWGRNDQEQLKRFPYEINTIDIAARQAHTLGLREDGTVFAWGANGSGQTNVPAGLTNGVGIAAGSAHSLALRSDGSVVGWGANGSGQINTNGIAALKAISAGGNQSLGLRTDGSVVQWGQTNGSPPNLNDATAIASGTNFHLALRSNGAVVAWGANASGQTNVPSAALSGVVAIAAGGAHALALKTNGTVVPWGSMTTVPSGLSNVMAIAAGYEHSLALKNDGTVVAWGNNPYGQLNVITNLTDVKRIAAGADFSLVSIYSPLVQYPVDVSKDLLLIYNASSTDSMTVKDYYLAHRPGVTGANVLGVTCTNMLGTGYINYPTFTQGQYTNFEAQVKTWLTNNPTKRPQYVLLFNNIPWRITKSPAVTPFGTYDQSPTNSPGSVQYLLHTTCAPGWAPFVTAINMSTNADACIGYINKLRDMAGTNQHLLLSAQASGYGNTIYVVDDVRHGEFLGSTAVSNAVTGLLTSGISSNNILYSWGNEYCIEWQTNVVDGITNRVCTKHIQLPHPLTNAVNVAGYICWGAHSSLGHQYANYFVKWQGESAWWIIQTIESFNGQPGGGHGDYYMWFADWAFGGTNYSRTPVGAVTHVDEPYLDNVNDATKYFGLWARGRNFANCAWNSRNTQNFQAIGDPLLVR